MDLPHGADSAAAGPSASADSKAPASEDSGPRDDDERFIVGLVLSYYRRHPQRARTRLLDLLGEVLTPTAGAAAGAAGAASSTAGRPAPAAPVDEHSLWLRTQTGVAPLKPRK